MARLDGKVAIVTGGAQGQGAAICRGFVAEGARVVVADVAVEEGEVLAKELGDSALFVRHDVTSEDDWAATVAAAEETFGRVDVLVNNAGILLFSELTATSLADYERVIRVNQFGTFLGMRAVVPAMERAGGGSIVNSSSIEGLGGMPFLVAYSSSKFAIRGMTKAAAMEVGPKGIRVHAISPGPLKTRAASGLKDFDLLLNEAMQRAPLGDLIDIEDVGFACAYLATPLARRLTGTTLYVDGGVNIMA